MAKYVVIDTNVLLDNIESLQIDGVPTLLSHTLRELEKHKIGNNAELAYRARSAVRYIEENSDKFHFDLKDYRFEANSEFDSCYQDNNILQACIDNGYTLMTNDLLLKQKARGFGVELIDVKNNDYGYYKGYFEVSLSDDEMAEIYEHPDRNTFNLVCNQYLIVRNENNDVVDKLRWNGEKLVKLKLPHIPKLKSKHYLQDCALDLLYNTDITTKIIMGTYGSGKTYLSTKVALHNTLDKGKFKKILVVREPVGEGKEIGYLKGDKDAKTADFFKPIQHSLQDTAHTVESLEFNGYLEKDIPYFLKGTTYNDTTILVDEAEDLSYPLLKLVGTRVGINSNIIFSGDYKQAVTNKGLSNGLVQLANKLKGNPLFGVIDLVEDVRSETSKMFAELD